MGSGRQAKKKLSLYLDEPYTQVQAYPASIKRPKAWLGLQQVVFVASRNQNSVRFESVILLPKYQLSNYCPGPTLGSPRRIGP